MKHDVERYMTASNPVKDPRSEWDEERASQVLTRITSEPASDERRTATASTRRRTWGLSIAGLSAAVVLGAMVVGVGPSLIPGSDSPAFAATPNPLTVAHTPSSDGAAEHLLQIASRTQALPDDTGSGDVAEVTIKSWDLFTRIDDVQVTSEVVPARTTTRTTSDGQVSTDRRFLVGGYGSEQFSDQTDLAYPLRGLSSDDATLSRQLGIGQPSSNGTAGQFDSIVQAYRQMPLEPKVRAAVLRHLATLPDVKSVGAVTDRAGRPGVGLTVDSSYSGLPTRYMLIIDANDGKVLSYEEMLTEDPGKLNVQIPSVISYQVFEDAQYAN